MRSKPEKHDEAAGMEKAAEKPLPRWVPVQNISRKEYKRLLQMRESCRLRKPGELLEDPEKES